MSYERTPINASDVPNDVMDGLLRELRKRYAESGQMIPRFIEGMFVFDGCWYGFDRQTHGYYKIQRDPLA